MKTKNICSTPYKKQKEVNERLFNSILTHFSDDRNGVVIALSGVSEAKSQIVEIGPIISINNAKSQKIAHRIIEIIKQLSYLHIELENLDNSATTAINKYNYDSTNYPTIENLECIVKAFVTQVSRMLQNDVLDILNIFCDKDFQGSAFGKTKDDKDGKVLTYAHEFAKKKNRTLFPEKSIIKKFNEVQNFATEIFRMRNAIEHPNGTSGKFIVNDFEFLEDVHANRNELKILTINNNMPKGLQEPTLIWHCKSELDNAALKKRFDNSVENNTIGISIDIRARPLIPALRNMLSDLINVIETCFEIFMNTHTLDSVLFEKSESKKSLQLYYYKDDGTKVEISNKKTTIIQHQM